MVVQLASGAIGRGVRGAVSVVDGLLPGGTLEYVVTGSGLGGLPDLRLADTLGDGQRMDTVFRPHVAIQRGAALLFDGELLGWSGVRSATTATTAIDFDLAPTLRGAGLATGLLDDDVVTVTFRSRILSLYAAMAPPPLGRSLVQGDVLRNGAQFTGTVGGRLASSDPATAQVALPTGALTSEVYAVNGIRTEGGVAAAGFGDVVTYRLRLAMPLSAAHAVQIVAAAPGLAVPIVFDGTGSAPTPGAGHAQWGPDGDHTATAPVITPTGDGRLGVSFGEIQPVYGQAPHVIDLLISAPLAAGREGAALTFTATETESNDFARVATTAAPPATLSLGEPVLSIQLGTVYASNDGATWTGTGGPAGYDPFFGQFGDTISSAGLAAEPFADQLRGIDAADEVTFAAAVQNLVPGARAYDIVLHGTLPPGFSVPARGHDLSVTDGAGTPLAATGDLFAPGGLALAPGVSLGGYAEDGGRNVLLVSYTLRSDDAFDTGLRLRTATVTIDHYATQPGWADRASLLPAGAATAATTVETKPAAVQVTLRSSDDPGTADPLLARGESATFRIVAILPEGSSPGLDVAAALPPGFTPVSAQVVSIGTQILPQRQASDGAGGIDFGATLNTPDDRDTVADRIVLDVVARPAAAAPATAAVGASVSVAAPDGTRLVTGAPGRVAVAVAPPVTPGLTLAAGTATAGVGQEVAFSLTLALPPGTSPAVLIQDILPVGLDYVAGSARLLADGGTRAEGGGALALRAVLAGRVLSFDLGAVVAPAAVSRQIVLGFSARVAAPAGTVLADSAQVATGFASSAVLAAAVTVINTVPVLTGVAAALAGRDDTVITPFAGLRVSDPDAGQAETLRIVVGSPGHGTVTVGGAGAYDPGSGIFTATGTAAEVAAAAAALRFTPARHLANLGQSVTTRFDATVTDAAGAAGPATAITLTTAVTDSAPLLRNAAPCEATAPGAAVHLFTGLQVSDADFGQVETLTIRLSDPGLGTLSGPGVADLAGGTLTLTGTVNALQEAAGRVLFTAAGAAPGRIGTVELTLDDGAGGVARDTAALAITPSSIGLHGAVPAFIGPPGAVVLVDPAGPSIIAGSAGRDAYYIDGVAAPQRVALAGFGGGDAVTLWGFDPAAPWRWSDGDGPTGQAGRTLLVGIPGAGETAVTFAGLAATDTDRFAIGSGRFEGLDYLSILSPS